MKTAFDGTYAGAARTLEGNIDADTMTRFCLPNSQPPPLTIVNGIVTWAGAHGSVSPQGVLVIPNQKYGARIDAQIDDHGTVRGRLSSACIYQMVWQKNGK